MSNDNELIELLAKEIAKKLGENLSTNTNNNIEKRYLNGKEAAEYLGVSYKVFKEIREQGELNPIKYPGIAKIWFDKKDLDQLAKSNKIK